MTEELELRAAAGSIAPDLQAEFPGLKIDWISAAVRVRESPRAVQRRLTDLSDRFRGASVIAMRTHPIPQAYRAFFHQIGLDPDVSPVPIEKAATERLIQGQFRPRNLVEDALLIALLETNVPVWALDADLVDVGGVGIRVAVPGDRLGAAERSSHLRAGRLVVADARCIHAPLFGDVAPGHGVSSGTTRVVLFTVTVPAVPAMHFEEALWICVEILNAAQEAQPSRPDGW